MVQIENPNQQLRERKVKAEQAAGSLCSRSDKEPVSTEAKQPPPPSLAWAKAGRAQSRPTRLQLHDDLWGGKMDFSLLTDINISLVMDIYYLHII